jgi:hypothetical protein
MVPAPKFKLIDTFIDFENLNSKEIISKYRALKGTNFGGIKTQF